MSIRPVVLAGGSGARLWPLSRKLYPKQYLSILGTVSLFQQALARVRLLGENIDALVICHEDHRFLALEQSQSVLPPGKLLLESEGKNTAPAATLAALYLKSVQSSAAAEDVMLLLPSDHTVSDVKAFVTAVKLAAEAAAQGYVVAFGVRPTFPATGYGYIEVSDVPGPFPGSFALTGFVEKPDESRAIAYVQSGRYLWNGGMFMMLPSVWLAHIERLRPDILVSCRHAFEAARIDGAFLRPDPALFAQCPADSIDYAVMEKIAIPPKKPERGATNDKLGNLSSKGAVVFPLDAGWSDVGSWSAVANGAEPKGGEGNLIKGDVVTLETTDSVVVAEHRLVTTVGLNEAIVIETPDAILVTNKAHAEQVKELTSLLKDRGRVEYESHRRVYRPWGSYEAVDSGPRFQVKRLTVKPGAALSLQMHHHRSEHWIVVYGTAKVTRGRDTFLLFENQSTDIPVGTIHRLENPGAIPLEIIEVQSGNYLGEDDIVRLEDRYDRATSQLPAPGG